MRHFPKISIKDCLLKDQGKIRYSQLTVVSIKENTPEVQTGTTHSEEEEPSTINHELSATSYELIALLFSTPGPSGHPRQETVS
jgi:hypothetical protein